jgi:1,2-diacylglycerol 3-alpha-glucosyltransferase
MKIAVLVPNFSEYSGDARVAELQIRDLMRAGHTVDIYCLHGTIQIDGCRKTEIGCPRTPSFERIYRLLFPVDLRRFAATVLRMRDYDCVVCHLYPLTAVGMLSKFLFSKRYVFWYHGIPPPNLYPFTYERLYMRAFIALSGITTSTADKRVSVSHAASDEYLEYAGQSSAVKYNKPDLERFNKELSGAALRERLGFNGKKVVLNVGRVCPQKGAHLLIEAFKKVRVSHPDSVLVIVGKPTYSYYQDQLEKSCGEGVMFAGFVNDAELPEYYAMCDVYATGTLWEAHNVPILEVQAVGKTVVGFDIPSLREGIDENGVLVPVGDTGRLADAISAVLNRSRTDAQK